MPTDREVTFSDVERAASQRDPALADLVVRYLQLPDPPEDRPEEGLEDDQKAQQLGSDAWTLQRLRRTVHPDRFYGSTDEEARATRMSAWENLLSAPYPPPRLKLGGLLIGLYEEGDEPGRAALIDIFKRAQLCWGIWQAFKRIYKLAEERHDAQMFGALAYRLDALYQTSYRRGEISNATFQYMRRRAWRYLRLLGMAVPEAYPQFCVQVLRHYGRDFQFWSSWIANQIWAHQDLLYSTSAYQSGPPADLSRRAYDEAWKLSADPLLRLLEDASNDKVCDFAIRSLRRDFPDTLRQVDPTWLARIGGKPLASVHDFVVQLMTDSPEFHQSKLRELGLHDTVLSFLWSDSQKARTYAIEYARAHAPDISIEDLVQIVLTAPSDSKELATARLNEKAGTELGVDVLITLLGASVTQEMAETKLQQHFKPGDITQDHFITLMMGSSAQQAFAKKFYDDNKTPVPAPYYIALLEHPQCGWSQRQSAMQELSQRSAREIGIDWIKNALLDNNLQYEVGQWIMRGMLKGDDLDVEWIKGLVMRASLRHIGLSVLGNRELVEPHRVGLRWLLALARQSDEQLNTFAHRYLLEHFTPRDFAADAGSEDVSVGISRLWQLAAGDEPESVRAFAATYLQVHHPDLSANHPEARALGLQPRLTHDAYGLDRVRATFADERPDVRRLGAIIAEVEIVRWNEPGVLYDLAESRYREPRRVAARILLQIGRPGADAEHVPPEDWLDPARTFALAESPVKSSRELASTLIRRHYERLGGAQRLAWLMESPYREVRLFAVRLLWDRHRPIDIPADWAPKRGEAPPAASGDRFDSTEALRQFMRTVMFGLPPGRMERRDPAAGELPERALPASVAKSRLIGVVRDMAIENVEFAGVAVPVLEEFMHSRAKGEWQGCVAAIARIRRAHPGLDTVLPVGSFSGGAA